MVCNTGLQREGTVCFVEESSCDERSAAVVVNSATGMDVAQGLEWHEWVWGRELDLLSTFGVRKKCSIGSPAGQGTARRGR
tara:strand:- start:9308 stop:9550 length:243 start_codon:yes stop_codon:yes gene_type:complete